MTAEFNYVKMSALTMELVIKEDVSALKVGKEMTVQ